MEAGWSRSNANRKSLSRSWRSREDKSKNVKSSVERLWSRRRCSTYTFIGWCVPCQTALVSSSREHVIVVKQTQTLDGAVQGAA